MINIMSWTPFACEETNADAKCNSIQLRRQMNAELDGVDLTNCHLFDFCAVLDWTCHAFHWKADPAKLKGYG